MTFDFPRSVSQRRAYRRCGHLWLHRYGHGWQGVTRRGTYAFGDDMEAVCHAVLTGRLTTPEDMASELQARWLPRKDDPTLTWTERGPWKLLNDRAPALCKVTFRELTEKCLIGEPEALHNVKHTYEVAPGVRETVIPDYVGSVCQARMGLEDGVPFVAEWAAERVWSIVDFKTSDRAYEPLSIELDEQLTSYQYGEGMQGRSVKQVGLMVLIYSATPRVQWLMRPARDVGELAQFVAGAVLVDQRIQRGEFDRNPGACHSLGACDMIPVCYPSQHSRIATELRQDQAKAATEPSALDWE